MKRRHHQRGAALLLAMLTVTLVSTLAAVALWQQWRAVEVESAERTRAQLSWILTGALDWSRLILQEDARASQVDHLSEPWALPLKEARLSSFLAFDKSNTEDAGDAFLSGQITDMQSRMNVLNLVDKGKISPASRRAFGKLFRLLHLPEAELDTLTENLRQAGVIDQPLAQAPLLPQRLEQLVGLGLSPGTVRALTPYVTVLPEPTPVNLNTASPEVMCASVPGLEFGRAQELVAQRAAAHFRTMADVVRETGVSADRLDTGQLGISSRFFEVLGRLRLGQLTTQERSLVERRGQEAVVLWREREVAQAPATSLANR